MGSIPAWAGETAEVKAKHEYGTVYPRVGGGNWEWFGREFGREGLSPRGRGKPIQLQAGMFAVRSIPAWAGETRRRVSPFNDMKVYPRVGGGNLGSRA